MKHSTPILNAVRAMHRDDDTRTGYNPYQHGSRRYVDPEAHITEAQRREAADLLECFATTLTLEK